MTKDEILHSHPIVSNNRGSDLFISLESARRAMQTYADQYASKLHQVEQENADLRRQNDKLKQQAEGWRPLLEDALRENNHTAMYPDHFINKITKFLYGE